MFFDKGKLHKVIEVQNYHIGSTFTSLGVPSSPIIFQIPKVENPDKDNDADWIQMTSKSTAWQLDADNLSLAVSGTQRALRVVRALETDNCFWKW